jgi:peptidoglycan hydrolase-like protein with peptidoglycan-binding domain
VALSAGPTSSLASGTGVRRLEASDATPPTTTEHQIALTSGDEGRQVRLLQEALGISADGVYGPETEAAVLRYQASRGLTADNVVGPQTTTALSADAPVSVPVEKVEEEISGESKSEREEASNLRRLQAALRLPVDGQFGPGTEAAIKRLQARAGIAPDGVVGPATWSVIGVHGAATLSPPPSALPRPTHHRAARAAQGNGGTHNPGSAVAQLQAALHLAVDGEFGPETEAAIKRLQSRHGLAADGVVGPATWSVIGVRGGPTLDPPAEARTGGTEGSANSAEGSSEGSSEAAGVVERVVAAADEIATRPYVFGGGHGSFQSEGYDCSGSVSYALHGGGLLSSPEDSSALEGYGEAGPGRDITIYANAEHAFMVVDGRRFDTVALAETGNRWSSSMTSTAGYVVRHPAGY